MSEQQLEQQAATATPEPTGGESGGFDMDAAVAELGEQVFGAETEGEKEPEPKGEPQPDTAEVKEPEPEASADAAAAKPAVEGVPAPDTWTKEAREAWATLPPVVQKEFAKREGDIARYVNETRGKVQVADGIGQLLAPYQQLFSQYNVNVWKHMEQLLAGHYNLVFGPPEVKQQLALSLLKDAGIDPAKLASGEPQQAVAQPSKDVQFILQRMAAMEQGVTGVTQRLNAQRASELDAQVAAFAEDPKHPHFYAVYKEIAQLLDSGVCRTLDDAYDKAVWGNPAIRLQEQERIAKDAEAKRTKEAGEKLKTSRRAAAVNVRGQGTGSGAANGAGNWEDSLEGTLREIRARG